MLFILGMYEDVVCKHVLSYGKKNPWGRGWGWWWYRAMGRATQSKKGKMKTWKLCRMGS